MNTNILDFGAVGDGRTLNTVCIQNAIDACEQSGGGRVTVPAGCYVSGTIRLKSNVELHLEHNAVIKASENLDDYNETSEYPQNYDVPSEKWCGKHLMFAVGQKNTAITGTGTIDGSADAFFGDVLHHFSNLYWGKGYYTTREDIGLRPGQLICFVECEDVVCRDFTIRNTTSWGLFVYGCDSVSISGLRIFNNDQHVNTDGIDIDTSRYVAVTNCIILTGDDCLTLRCAGQRLLREEKVCEYVSVSNCVFSCSAAAVRIGVGYGEIRHATFSGIVIKNAAAAFEFDTAFEHRGHAEIRDININNVSFDEVSYPILMVSDNIPVERISVSNFNGGCTGSIRVLGSNRCISDFTLQNALIRHKTGTVRFPETAREDFSGEFVQIKGVTRLSLRDVRVLLRDDYFEGHSEALCIRDTHFLSDDLTVIHKGKETRFLRGE